MKLRVNVAQGTNRYRTSDRNVFDALFVFVFLSLVFIVSSSILFRVVLDQIAQARDPFAMRVAELSRPRATVIGDSGRSGRIGQLIGLLGSRELADKVEGKLVAAFPGYDDIVVWTAETKHFLNGFLYKPLSIERFPLMPLDDAEHERFLKRDGGTTIIRLKQPDVATKRQSSDLLWVRALRSYAESHPEHDLFMYLIPSPEDIVSKSPMGVHYPYYSDYIDRLRRDLGDVVHFDHLEYDLSTIDELFFRTDHHWNIYGAYQGYLDIVAMLNRKYEILSPVILEPTRTVVLENVVFRGSHAKKAAFHRLTDEIRDFRFDMSDVSIWINDIPVQSRGFPEMYLSNHTNWPLFFNHYGSYFGGDFAKVEYYNPEADVSGTLLVIADSYSQAMERFLSTHFRHVVVVDLRVYESTYGEPFDIGRFVQEFGAGDVLILLGSFTLKVGYGRLLEEALSARGIF